MASASTVATRRGSGMSSDSGLKDSDIGGPDPELDERPSLLDKNGISRIFIDAVAYSEVISDDEEKDREQRHGQDKEEKQEQEKDQERIEPQHMKGAPRDADAVSVRRFANLVGRDLSQPDLAASERFAKFSVSSWLKGGNVLDTPATTEPGEMDEEEEAELKEKEELPAEDKADEELSAARISELDLKEAERTQPERSTSVSQLTPKEIVRLLVEEFGPLATSDFDEERLIFEMDGAYFQEIAILGMIHLTTHRLSFHASLLSTRPDLLPERQIIKRGPVTLHRPGLRRKRRVWLELSHDMLTTFPSGNQEDRIRPIRSVLLSSIKQILPEDPKNKRALRIVSTSPELPGDKFGEFDNEESAREWRREIQGAVYIYCHSRDVYLSRSSEDEANGVRISIPLSRVKIFSTRKFLKYANVISLELSSSEVRTTRLRSSSVSSGSRDDEGSENAQSFEDEEIDIEGRTLELCGVLKLHAWDDFGELVEKAKERERNASMAASPKVIVDFGELSFVERRREARKVEDDKEEAIRIALSLGYESEIWYARSRITRSIASTGYFVVSTHYIGFWTKGFSIADVKYRFPINRVVGARPNFRFLPRTFGAILDLKEGKPSMFFDFSTQELRDEVISRVAAAVEKYHVQAPSIPSSSISSTMPGLTQSVTPSHSRKGSSTFGPLVESPPETPMPMSPGLGATQVLSPLSHTVARATTRRLPREALRLLPKVINLPESVVPRMDAAHYVCLTIGSRGDVQPYIALAQELIRNGHSVTIVTHAEYKEWIEGWGVRHRTAGGDPGALMKLSVEHKMFSPQFFKESIGNFRSWLDDLLVDAWEACKDADVLLESPSAMAGVHIAEALNIPYFRTFTMPWTKTTQFPHPFLSPPVEMASFNASTYVLFDNIFWTATSGQINRWRRNTLHLENTDMGHLAQSKIPFIYNFSPSVVPKPLDWGDAIVVSGYWFLDNPELNWTPPDSLLQFMSKAREDAKPIVYIGFGSITVPNPPAMTRSIVKAVVKSDVRAIISKGWSSRMSKPDEPVFEFPPECYPIDKVPHDWLFPLVDAVLHHGGAGTTGASLRAGIPTLIKPWFGDQFFWASRVQRLGAGMKVSNLQSPELASALIRATSDRLMKERAASVGENIRSENGVQNAVKAIYMYRTRASRDRTELD